ncbi:unnamed protein product [[Candida] boidinii]|nr:unnamed protein product [[Candida] boidinii]
MCRQTFNLDSEKLVNKGIKMHNHSQYFQQSNLETDGDDIDGDGTGDVDADVDGDGDNGERASIMTSASNIEMREAIRNGESGD